MIPPGFGSFAIGFTIAALAVVIVFLGLAVFGLVLVFT